MSLRGAVDAAIGIGLLPVIVVTGIVFGLTFLVLLLLGWLSGKGWEHEAEERGERWRKAREARSAK